MTRDVLEGIGEIVTGQAMIYRTLGNLAAEDWCGPSRPSC